MRVTQQGAGHWASKLDEDQVKEILHFYYKSACSVRWISKKYSVSYNTIRYIVQRKTWKHVSLPRGVRVMDVVQPKVYGAKQ